MGLGEVRVPVVSKTTKVYFVFPVISRNEKIPSMSCLLEINHFLKRDF